MKRLCLISFILSASCLKLMAGSAAVEDFNITAFYPASTPVTGTISAMWGSYSGGVFTPFFSSTQSAINTGYLDTAGNELVVVLTQSDNNTITAGANLFVSIFNVLGGGGTSTWTSGSAQIILSDPTWVAPTFTLTTPSDVFGLTASTFALSLNGGTGVYNFNGGSPTVTLARPKSSPSGGSFTARAPGGVRFLTGTDETTGVNLANGATSWASLSDRHAKTAPAQLDHRDTLRKVADLPVASWEYKHDPNRRYVGPMAQDFRAAFDLGHDDKHISTLDMDGVTLSALQGLVAELQERKNRSAAQAVRLRELETELQGLQRQMAAH